MAAPVTITMQVDTFSARVAQFVQTHLQTADRIVFEVASAVKASIQEGWPVDTGVSRAGWDGPRPVAPGHWRLSNPFDYSLTIEYGGYARVGPKTGEVSGFVLPDHIQVATGIFPTQRPAAPARRALSKHRNDMQKKLAVALHQAWGR